MKQFLAKVFSFFIGVLIIVVIGFFTTGRISPHHYLSAYFDKSKILAENKAIKKIIFSGGSSTSFGIDTKLIEATVEDYSVVNVGLHAGLSLEFILKSIDTNYLNNGDIVVFTPEYELWLKNKKANYSKSIYLIKSQPSLMEYESLKNIIFNPLSYRIDWWFIRKNGTVDSVYNRSNFDDKGNIINFPNYRNVEPSHIGEMSIDERSLNLIKNIQKKYLQKQIKLVIGFPPVRTSFYNINSRKIKKIEDVLRSKGIETILSPENVVYNDSLFSDSPYHLNNSGRKVHSMNIGAFLNKKLRNVDPN